MTRFAHTISPRPARSFDPQFIELVQTYMRLSREKAALEMAVERLEAQLENARRDEQARQRAEQEEVALQLAAMADDRAEWQEQWRA
jgi:hypothetical protein